MSDTGSLVVLTLECRARSILNDWTVDNHGNVFMIQIVVKY